MKKNKEGLKLEEVIRKILQRKVEKGRKSTKQAKANK